MTRRSVAIAGLWAVVLLLAWAIVLLRSPGPPDADHQGDSATVASPGNTTGRIQTAVSTSRNEPIRLPPAEAATAAQPTDPVLEALQLEIVHSHGLPAGQVMVVLARGPRVLATRRTGSDGRVQFGPFRGEIELFVGGVSDRPHHRTLAQGIGTHRIELPDGAVLSGLVLVDGAPPRQPVPLWLAPQDHSDVPWSIRMALQQTVSGLALSKGEAAQLTGDAGRFVFSGLRDGWTGHVSFPLAYHLGGVADSQPVRAPSTGLVLDLFTFPSARGRVVAAEGPVAGARVEYVIQHAAGGMGGAVFCDEDGRFAIPNLEDAVASLRLELSRPDGSGHRVLDIERFDHRHDTDLGDIVLRDTREVPFVVLDPGGAPIPGAVAAANGRLSPPTDEDGQGLLISVPLPTRSVSVHALRHGTAVVSLPRELEQPLRVVLQPCASFDLLVIGPDGAVPEGLELRLAAHENLLVDAVGFESEAMETRYAVGMRRPRGVSLQTDNRIQPPTVSGRFFFPLPRDGRLTLGCLTPGEPFTVELGDAYGFVAWGPETLALQPGEQRLQRVPLAVVAVDLAGLVHTPEGEPVYRASVTLRTGELEDPPQARTDRQGRFRFQQVHGLVADLAVQRDGYAPLRRRRLPVPRDGTPLQLVLQPGLEVSVFVEDPTGLPVQADSVTAMLDGSTVSRAPSSHLGRGRVGSAAPVADAPGWLLADLPAQTVTLRVRAGGRRFEQDHDATIPEAHVVLPASGSLEVHWPWPLDEALNCTLEMRPRENRGDTLIRSLSQQARAQGTLLVPTLFPGRYDVQMLAHRAGDGLSTPLSQRHAVDIRPGEMTSQTLEP